MSRAIVITITRGTKTRSSLNLLGASLPENQRQIRVQRSAPRIVIKVMSMLFSGK